jgi:hypothetical protein
MVSFQPALAINSEKVLFRGQKAATPVQLAVIRRIVAILDASSR